MPRKNKAYVMIYVLAILALVMPAMLATTMVINARLEDTAKLQALADKANNTNNATRYLPQQLPQHQKREDERLPMF